MLHIVSLWIKKPPVPIACCQWTVEQGFSTTDAQK
jgi:hypothetical protein